jgi:hypothetical protein
LRVACGKVLTNTHFKRFTSPELKTVHRRVIAVIARMLYSGCHQGLFLSSQAYLPEWGAEEAEKHVFRDRLSQKSPMSKDRTNCDPIAHGLQLRFRVSQQPRIGCQWTAQAKRGVESAEHVEKAEHDFQQFGSHSISGCVRTDSHQARVFPHH